MKRILPFMFLLTTLFTSCNTEPVNLSDNDYIIFGQYYGECIGENCVVIYKLDKNNLYKDKNHTYPNSTNFYIADFTVLNEDNFEKTKDLIDFFPTELLNENNVVIGEPDAGDWGGIYVEYYVGSIHKFWLIDKMRTNVPEKYHLFLDKIEEKISQLNTENEL